MLHGVANKQNKYGRKESKKMSACMRPQSCLTLCDPMDCSLPGSSVHGIFQARILEWIVCICITDSLFNKYETNTTL